MNGSRKFQTIIYSNQLRHYSLKSLLKGMVTFWQILRLKAFGTGSIDKMLTITEIIISWEWHYARYWYQFRIILAQWVILFVCHFCHHLFLLPKTCIYLSLKRRKMNGPDFMLSSLYYRIGYFIFTRALSKLRPWEYKISVWSYNYWKH